MRGLFAAAGLLLAWMLAVWANSPSHRLAIDAPLDRFSAERAMNVVREVGQAPHPMGSVEDKAVILDLVHRFAGLGLPVTLQPVATDKAALDKYALWSGKPAPAGLSGTNVLAVLPGRDLSQPAVVLMAHHDSVWASPGAADDGIGVATLLETARVLRAGPRPQRDIVFLITDGEELGLLGAKSFFANPVARAHVGVVLNFEARGAAGLAMMIETGTSNGAMMRSFAKAVPWPSAGSLAVFVYRRMPNGTDLTHAIRAGLPGFNFAIGDRAGLYHSPMATPDRLSRRSLQDMGQQALALTRELAMAPMLPAKADDATFSDLWGTRLIVYPAWGGWVLLAIALGGAGFAARRVKPPVRDVAAALAVPAILLVGGAVLQFAVNWLSGAGAQANYYDRLASLPRLEIQMALLCGAVLLPLSRWGPSAWPGWFGQFGFLWLAGLALQALAPTATTILHWPLLLGGLSMAIAAWLDPTLERPYALAPVALLAAAGAAQQLAIVHQLFLLVGAATPAVVLIPLLGALMLLWPLVHRMMPDADAKAAAAACIIVAIGLALWVRLDPIAASIPPYVDGKR